MSRIRLHQGVIGGGSGDGITQAELDAAIAAHALDTDPHAPYQKESEKDQLSGYASLDGTGVIPLEEIPTLSDPNALPKSDFATSFSIRKTGAPSGIDDTALIQGLHDAASPGETILLPPGVYFTDQLNWTKQVNLLGLGTHENSVTIKARSGATGPLLNVNMPSLAHGLRFDNFYVDLTQATGIGALYLNNLDFARFKNVKVREGTTAFDIAHLAGSTFENCLGFNQRTSSYRVADAAAIGNTYIDCKSYMTSGAAADMSVAMFDISNGQSQYLIGCEFLRTPGIAHYVPYGIKVDSPAATDFLYLTSCYTDGISDGTLNSSSSASLYLKGVHSAFIVNSFFSANDSLAKRERGMRMENSSQIYVSNTRISGSGLEWVGANDRIFLENVDFPSVYQDAMFNFAPGATATNVEYGRLSGGTTTGLRPSLVSDADAATLRAGLRNQHVLPSFARAPVDEDFQYDPLDGTPVWNSDEERIYVRSGGAFVPSAPAGRKLASTMLWEN